MGVDSCPCIQMVPLAQDTSTQTQTFQATGSRLSLPLSLDTGSRLPSTAMQNQLSWTGEGQTLSVSTSGHLTEGAMGPQEGQAESRDGLDRDAGWPRKRRTPLSPADPHPRTCQLGPAHSGWGSDRLDHLPGPSPPEWAHGDMAEGPSRCAAHCSKGRHPFNPEVTFPGPQSWDNCHSSA